MTKKECVINKEDREARASQRLLLAAIPLAILLRIICASSNEFWLDEIWSIKGVQSLEWLGGVFTKFISDNNHPLNSIYLFLIDALGPDQTQNYWYLITRLPSVLFGSATIFIAYQLGNCLKPRSGNVFSMMIAFSYLQILYSSEARGYAGAVFAAILGAHILLSSKTLLPVDRDVIDYKGHNIAGGTSGDGASNLELKESDFFKVSTKLFVISVIGLLSHLSYVVFLVAASVWLFLIRDKQSLVQRALVSIKLLAPSLGFAGALFVLFYRHLPKGSGALGDKTIFILNTISAIFGGPEISVHAPVATLVVLGLALVFVILVLVEGIKAIKKQDQATLLFFLVAIPVPLVLYYIYAPRVIYPRYFLVSITFFLGLCANNLVRLYSVSIVNRILSILLLALFLGNSLLKSYDLVRWGRGAPLEVVKLIDSETLSSVASISAQQDARAFDTIGFYQAQFSRIKPEYIPNRARATEWYLVDSQDPFEVPGQAISPYAGYQHCLKGSFNSAELSGFRWFVYQDCSTQR